MLQSRELLPSPCHLYYNCGMCRDFLFVILFALTGTNATAGLIINGLVVSNKAVFNWSKKCIVTPVIS